MFWIRIKELRQSLGMNQVQFGKSLSVTKQSVSNWENGYIQPSIDMLVRIAKQYAVSTDYLLGLSDRQLLDVTGLSCQQTAHLQALADDLKAANRKTDPGQSLKRS